MTEQKPESDVAALSYEEAREQLIAVVGRLEAGGASLEESLALWERGEALVSMRTNDETGTRWPAGVLILRSSRGPTVERSSKPI